jgi:hypothetical protein
MDFQVFIGLSVDQTLFDEDPTSEALEALLEQASEQLAQHLWATASSQGSALRQIHATCGLYDLTDTSAPRARFRKQGEQLELELTVDWRPMFGQQVLDQARVVVENVQLAIAGALQRKQQRALADACRNFHPDFDLDSALAKRRAWLEGWNGQPAP